MADPPRRSFLRRLRALARSRFKNGFHPYRKWKFRGIEDRFAVRTRHEAQHILYRIVLEDEYRISRERFESSDVVIDIGSHIGVFSYLAHVRGSRNIHSFEADAENHALSQSSLRDLPGIQVHHQAVGRSDAEAGTKAVHSGYIQDNTGGGNVIMGGRPFEFCRQELFDRRPLAPAAQTAVVRLDDILEQFGSVRLLKIDCEGSEFPILLTSRLLHRIKRIVGEYHEIEAHMMPYLDPGAAIKGFDRYHKQHLGDALAAQGFRVTFREFDRCIGMFDAIRVDGQGPG